MYFKQSFSNIQIFLSGLKYLNIPKLINLFQILFSYFISIFSDKITGKHAPFFLSVEPADFCQLECPECPVGINKRKQGNKIDISLFNKLISEQKETLFHLIFYFQGEPLLNKNLAEMISIAHKAGIFTSTSTNAQLLNSQMAKSLVESGLDKLIISMDGATQKVYEKYRIGGKLSLAIKGVEEINYWKKQLKSPTPFVEIQFVVFKTNEHQLNEMKHLARKLNADRLSFKSAQLYNFENGHPLLTSFKKFARYKQNENGKYELKAKMKNSCYRLWSGAVINTQGDVLPCCFDKNASHTFGNLNSESFATIYQNKKASGFRNEILSNRKQFEMCRNCTSK